MPLQSSVRCSSGHQFYVHHQKVFWPRDTWSCPRLWGVTVPKGGRSNCHQQESQGHSFKEGPKGRSKVCQSHDEGQNMNTVWPFKRPGREMYWAGRIRSHIYWSPQWNAAALSLQCAMLHQEHTEHMWELEACALTMENKSRHDFLIAFQAVLH